MGWASSCSHSWQTDASKMNQDLFFFFFFKSVAKLHCLASAAQQCVVVCLMYFLKGTLSDMSITHGSLSFVTSEIVLVCC